MAGSIVLYLILGIACGLLAEVAQRTNKTRWVWVMIACLTLIVGLRGYTVGIDTESYIEIFQHVAAGNSDAVFGTERTFLF